MMDCNRKDFWKILAAVLAAASAVATCVFLVAKYKDALCGFFGKLKEKFPFRVSVSVQREEDDYADDELNSFFMDYDEE